MIKRLCSKDEGIIAIHQPVVGIQKYFWYWRINDWDHMFDGQTLILDHFGYPRKSWYIYIYICCRIFSGVGMYPSTAASWSWYCVECISYLRLGVVLRLRLPAALTLAVQPFSHSSPSRLTAGQSSCTEKPRRANSSCTLDSCPFMVLDLNQTTLSWITVTLSSSDLEFLQLRWTLRVTKKKRRLETCPKATSPWRNEGPCITPCNAAWRMVWDWKLAWLRSTTQHVLQGRKSLTFSRSSWLMKTCPRLIFHFNRNEPTCSKDLELACFGWYSLI